MGLLGGHLLRGVRGAITVPSDNRLEILAATRRLLTALQEANGFTPEDIASIIFTVTPDLRSAFPAQAARELGWTEVALLDAQEIPVEGALPRCIRVLILVNIDRPQKEIKHLYLEEAQKLRPDLAFSHRRLVVAIDGPAGSGKSTVARALARELGLRYIDTGAMYRALTLKILDLGLPLEDEEAITSVAEETRLEVLEREGKTRVILDGHDVTEDLRSPAVNAGVSLVAQYPGVRAKLVALQREMAAEGGVILDGRDIGSYVWPKADFKFYLSAAPEERARRRLKELLASGHEITLPEVQKQLAQRDSLDTRRAVAPLVAAPDAAVIDTSDLRPEEVLERLLGIIREEGNVRPD
ncbi:MAG: (d)CMP kinase [Firmicutes bacterium]|nr:(d)CMP kinase [Bacillota bacterium]